MTAELARAGGPIGCLGLALLLVAPGRWARLAGLGAWALGMVFLAVYLAPHGHRAVLAAAAAVGVVLAALGAAVLRRWPWLLAAAALACAPIRIQVHVGSVDASLLVPLYGVVAAAALALAWGLLRDGGPARELGPIAWPLALFSAWSGLSLAWSGDLREGSTELLFFYLPFGLLAVAVARLPWSPRLLALVWAQLVAMAAAFALVGVYQWAAHDVFWNPKVIVGNAYAPFYRVNSIFYDPSMYGRFLAVAILATLAVVLGTRGRRLAAVGTAAIAVIWLGLLFSFSQSSFAALLAGTLLAAFLAWRRWMVAAVALAAVVAVAGGFTGGTVRLADGATGSRVALVENGIRIALDHPGNGVGIGGFKRAYGRRLHLPGREPKSAASHDTPVTVAAETGVPGLLLLAWLALAALRVPFRRRTGSFRGQASLVVGLALVVIMVHSLGYNALFEDPFFWGLLGIAALVARPAGPEEAA